MTTLQQAKEFGAKLVQSLYADWNKASKEFGTIKVSKLIGEENSVVLAQRCGHKDMIKSKSKTVPHLVKAIDNHEYKCDDKRPQYKSLAICSNSVASAQSNGELKEFIDWFSQEQENHYSRFAQVAIHDMPAAASADNNSQPFSNQFQHLNDQNLF